MTKKPNIILLRDIVLPFEQANKELALIKQDIDNSKEQRQIKSLFLYSYAIFESTLVQSYANILYAFPERMNADKIDFVKYKNDIISNSLSHINPAKRNVMVVKNEMRLLKQKRNVLQI